MSSEDSEDTEFEESGVSEEVSESEDEQRPRTRLVLQCFFFVLLYFSVLEIGPLRHDPVSKTAHC